MTMNLKGSKTTVYLKYAIWCMHFTGKYDDEAQRVEKLVIENRSVEQSVSIIDVCVV